MPGLRLQPRGLLRESPWVTRWRQRFAAPPSAAVAGPHPQTARPQARGKFLFVGAEKLYVRGVTYGPFRPGADGCEYHDPDLVGRDFAQIAANGFNAIRTYTLPPLWLLDLARHHGLWVMVGLAWEQHIAFLDDRSRAKAIEERVRAGIGACAGHPAILTYTIGNEIPAPIVRWHGRRPIERSLERIWRAAKAEDPDGLVTYVSYPTTEYLQLPFLDLVSFNVYLESQERLDSYLARLQNMASNRPLLLAEVGLDSRRNGEQTQASVLEWQLRTAFAAGCAGAFVFAWTDEWYRGGCDIDDWDFGLTDRFQRPKPALEKVKRTFTDIPFPRDLPWPRISVVVCTLNGERTLPECLEGLGKLRYPDYEVIVVDDGSQQDIAAIARGSPVRYIRTENRGLSCARNTGLEAASGEIVAYIDDDASPDPDWLSYLGATFLKTAYAGVGGPNLHPPTDGPVAHCVAHAPGGPTHVLLSDGEAEHIPGCNMAFRKDALEAIGGFDPQFRVAGDDVDVCWRLQQRGWKLGFNPAAMVWHHRRNSVRGYWRQQLGYGKAEAMLERKWPEKYNAAGHIPWAGRIYANYVSQTFGMRRGRIYHGTWGTSLFQSIYQPAPDTLRSVLAMPEWYLVVMALAVLSAIGLLWTPLLLLLPLLAFASGISLVQAGLSAASVVASPSQPRTRRARLSRWALTAVFHFLQPLARLCGRLHEGLTPWRWAARADKPPFPRTLALWSEQWRAPEAWLHILEKALRGQRAVVLRGGDFDRWDLEVRGGVLGAVRILTAVEEHGAGRQLMRVRAWPRCAQGAVWLALFFAVLATGATLDREWMASGILVAIGIVIAARTVAESARAMAALSRALDHCQAEGGYPIE